MADLDAILDSALDDFEEQQLAEKAADTAKKDVAAAKSKAQKTAAKEKEKRARAEENGAAATRIVRGVAATPWPEAGTAAAPRRRVQRLESTGAKEARIDAVRRPPSTAT